MWCPQHHACKQSDQCSVERMASQHMHILYTKLPLPFTLDHSRPAYTQSDYLPIPASCFAMLIARSTPPRPSIKPFCRARLPLQTRPCACFCSSSVGMRRDSAALSRKEAYANSALRSKRSSSSGVKLLVSPFSSAYLHAQASTSACTAIDNVNNIFSDSNYGLC